jgi:hypothetical protein
MIKIAEATKNSKMLVLQEVNLQAAKLVFLLETIDFSV